VQSTAEKYKKRGKFQKKKYRKKKTFFHQL